MCNDELLCFLAYLFRRVQPDTAGQILLDLEGRQDDGDIGEWFNLAQQAATEVDVMHMTRDEARLMWDEATE